MQRTRQPPCSHGNGIIPQPSWHLRRAAYSEASPPTQDHLIEFSGEGGKGRKMAKNARETSVHFFKYWL
jgi:hypothetical protein